MRNLTNKIGKISVIMSSYNHDKYIAEAIDSVLRQTYENWELIIVDDGSSDRSLEIIKGYVNKHPDKIKFLIHPGHKNMGLSLTYQLGIKNSTGGYIAFLESDDIWREDSLAVKIKPFGKHNDIALVYTDVEIFGEPGSWIEKNKEWLKHFRHINRENSYRPFNAKKILNGNFINSFSAVMVKRNSLNNLNFSVPKKYEMWLDLWLWGQLSLKGKFFYIPELQTKWRLHKESYNYKYMLATNKSMDDISNSSQQYKSFLKMLNKAVSKMRYKKTVAIVVPMYSGALSADVQISLRHLHHYLGKYDKYIIAPKNLNILHKQKNFNIYPLHEKYFTSRESYSRLLLSKSFYKTFRDYKYILIYQPDSLVFSSQLLEWCKKDYDYIGAPWYRTETMKAKGWAPDEDCVGNGGLSLRKVESHLEVLRVYQNPLNIAKHKLIACLHLLKSCLAKIPKKTINLITRRQSLKSMLRELYGQKKVIFCQQNEDIFWSLEAKKHYPDFKIPPPGIAVSFSFEVGPKHCFEKNNQTLPFGCHAWAKYDREFWKPYLLKEPVYPPTSK